ncbi:two-component sensor histidine kinase [Segetibacter sp. 3557_3]|uniref:sensor histidine kinase n=1 Tax=Segetibacter sp. 3557_3 TaxID=2547429 RepID=UPI00105840FE|nr:histidine kinase [Segetibacter sp. 3557_3]TDH18286.1 two-component sensor histidine kinase [Segetibacter sp. 3557_3]
MLVLNILQTPSLLAFGTFAMLLLTLSLILFIIFHQRRVIRYQIRMQQMEAEQQHMFLKASIKLQEEERQRIAADLHDDAGPLLATARLYLSENMVNLDKTDQLQSISSAKQLIDESIQLIRNISHSLMPPTLKNFGLESALNDFFQKLSGSGSLNVSCRFSNYSTRLNPEKELLIFRVIQELINNILKHSHSSYINLTQVNQEGNMLISLQHDGEGLTHEEFLSRSNSHAGLGLKNIQSRLKVINGNILFETDTHHSFYRTTLDIPKDLEDKPFSDN